jgi:hypothetical protein
VAKEIEIKETVKQSKKAADTIIIDSANSLCNLPLNRKVVYVHSDWDAVYKLYSEGLSLREKLIVADDPSCDDALNSIRQSLKNIEDKMVSSKYSQHFEGIVRKRTQSVDRMSNTEIQSSTRKRKNRESEATKLQRKRSKLEHRLQKDAIAYTVVCEK